MKSTELAHFIAQRSLEKKAEHVLIMDLKELTSITDHFVICTGETDIQVKAISDHILDKLKQENIRVWKTEGFEALNWVLLDFVDVVVHIFQPETRDYYALEKLWGDAETKEIKDE